MNRICIPHIDWLEKHTGFSNWTMTMYGIEGNHLRGPVSTKWLMTREDYCSIEFGSLLMAEHLIAILNELSREIEHLNLRYECSDIGKYKISVISTSIDDYVKRGENISRAIGILE